MKTSNEKEKKLVLALSKLKNLNHENPALANDLQNIEVIPKAISMHNEKVKFQISKMSGDHTIVTDENSTNTIEMDAIGIDEYFTDVLSKINFVIFTIEGAELKALKGMTETLRQSKELTLMTEFYPEKIRSLGDSPEEFIKLLVAESLR